MWRPEVPSFTRFSPHYHYRLALAHCFSLTERLADEVQEDTKSAERNNATQELWEALHFQPTHTAAASNVHNYTAGQTQSGHCHCLGPIPGKLVLIFMVEGTLLWKNPTYSALCVYVYTYYPSVLSWCATKVTELPCQIHPDPVQSNCGKKVVCGWEEGLFTVTWLVISSEKSFLAWLLIDSNTCCQECFTLCFPLAFFLTLLTT